MMTLAVARHYYKQDLMLMKLLSAMNVVQLSRFCYFFTVRQGTMLIAIIELSLTSFVLFLLLLGVTHAEDIVAMATADLQQLEESHWVMKYIEDPQIYITNNEKKMITGQHLAFMIMSIVCIGLVLASIHFVSCVMLLYGAIKNSSNYLLPWTSMVLLSLIAATLSLVALAFIPMEDCKLGFYAVAIAVICLELYAWLNVFSYYRQLKT